MSLLAGTKLGRYEIRSKIGEGGMGEVYLAEDTKLVRKVAIKLLPVASGTDEPANSRLLREAQAAARLDHPNICSIYEVGQLEERNYICMQYLEGETLQALISRQPVPLKNALNISIQLADALAEAHSQGIIHRDIKPANVMITPRGQAKVMDFGLARLEGAAESEAETQSLLTTPGTILGTVPYMSPEQVKGEKLDARTDIFSFGVVLYEMLSGRQPFAGKSAAETIAAILTEEPPTLSRYAPNLPEELPRIARKCLEKDRNLRYQNASEVCADLERLKRDTESAPVLEQPFGSRLGKTAKVPSVHQGSAFTPRKLIVPVIVVLLAFLAAAYFYYPRAPAVGSEIKSLAVLPLKSLDAGDNYLGLGIADAVIRRIGQTRQLIVRPTSSVRRYLNEETDALTAARQLKTDAVLEGSVQRAGDRLRVSVNLLRTSDGDSLWADSFDMKMTDIFTIQDTVAQQVASRLQLQLDSSQQARLTERYTSNPVAYDSYLKGAYIFDQRVTLTKLQWEATTDFFKKAIEADPNFALAHAQLGNVYATRAVFIETTEPAWAERARQEINQAQALDPQLAEIHLARSQLLFSIYEGYQGEAAVREVLLAQRLNPNAGHGELAYLFLHFGLEELAAREIKRGAEIDPTSEFVKQMALLSYTAGVKYDEWFAVSQKLQSNFEMKAWYFIGKRDLVEAQKAIDEWSAKTPDDIRLPPKRTLLLALKGDFRAAEAEIPIILSRHPVKDPLYHHAVYDFACVYALEGKIDEAVKWLREAAANGFPCYPLFARDPHLNRIRQTPAFVQFMAEMKAQNDKYRNEFGEDPTR